MVKIREKGNEYGVLIALLLIIIMVLIGYIAYNKGLDKNKGKEKLTTTTTTMVTTEKPKINEEYLYEEICKQEEICNKKIAAINLEGKEINLNIQTNNTDNKISQAINISGDLDKVISLVKFKKLKIIDSSFITIKSTSQSNEEEDILSLYDSNFNKLDEITINNLKDESYESLNLIYYTYDKDCQTNQDNYFGKESVLISDVGFEVINSSKGPLKTSGFLCKKVTEN